MYKYFPYLLAATTIMFAAGNSPACAKITYTVIHTFNKGALADREGINPSAGLVIDTHGNLWGTAPRGPCPSPVSCGGGTVYELSPRGTLLHQFNLDATTGYRPGGKLVLDPSGNVFGLGFLGKLNARQEYQSTIFKITPQYVLSAWLRLSPDTAGMGAGGLTLANGFLYAVNLDGPTKLWKISVVSKHLAIINGPRTDVTASSVWPYSSVAVDKDGTVWIPDAGDDAILGGLLGELWSYSSIIGKWSLALTESRRYGCNSMGIGTPFVGPSGEVYVAAVNGVNTKCGNSYNDGWLLERGRNGENRILATFYASQSGWPVGGVVMDSKGALYGMTWSNGTNSGSVYCVTTAGKLKMLVNFDGGAGGADGIGELAWDGKDSFYGVTQYGGTGSGLVFKMTVGSDCDY